jgi:hypothetical protein
MRAIVLLLLLAGCATRYGEEGWFSNGWTNSQLTDDTFIVSFKANAMTKADDTYKYALLRAAELALEEDYQYFLVLSSVDRSVTSRSELGVITTPGTSLTVKCFREKTMSEGAINARIFWEANRDKE